MKNAFNYTVTFLILLAITLLLSGIVITMNGCGSGFDPRTQYACKGHGHVVGCTSRGYYLCSDGFEDPQVCR